MARRVKSAAFYHAAQRVEKFARMSRGSACEKAGNGELFAGQYAA